MLTLQIIHRQNMAEIKDNVNNYIDAQKNTTLSKNFINILFDSTKLAATNVYHDLVTTYINMPESKFKAFHDSVGLFLYDEDKERPVTKKYKYDNNLKQTYLCYQYFDQKKSVALVKSIRTAFNLFQKMEEKFDKSLILFTYNDIRASIKSIADTTTTSSIRLKIQAIKKFMEWYRLNTLQILNHDIESPAWNEYDVSTKNIIMASRQKHITHSELMDIVKKEGQLNVQTTLMMLCAWKGVQRTWNAGTPNELTEMLRTDIDLENQVIYLDQGGRYERTVEILDEELPYFAELKDGTMGLKSDGDATSLSPAPYAFRQVFIGKVRTLNPLAYPTIVVRLRTITDKYSEEYDYNFDYRRIAHDGRLVYMRDWLRNNYDPSSNDNWNIRMAATATGYRFGMLDKYQKERILNSDEDKTISKILQKLILDYSSEKDLIE